MGDLVVPTRIMRARASGNMPTALLPGQIMVDEYLQRLVFPDATSTPNGSGQYTTFVTVDFKALVAALTAVRSLAAGGTGVSAASASDLLSKIGAQASLGFTPENAANKGQASGYAGLDSSGKVPLAILPASVSGAVNYQGTWNASTNSPALASGTGTKGYYYKVSTAGTTSIDGIAQWNVGDTIIFDGTTWDKLDGIANEVVSVAGLVGAITAAALKTALAIASGDITDATAIGKALVTIASAAALTAQINALVGDSGSGGTKGLAPAPGSGDAAAGKFLKADGTWSVPGSSGALSPAALYFGDGSDGTVTIGNGQTVTLTRDMYYANLTISGTGKLYPNGYRIFVQTLLDLSSAGAGAITAVGVSGTSATSTSGAGSVSGSTAGTIQLAGLAGGGGGSGDASYPSAGGGTGAGTIWGGVGSIGGAGGAGSSGSGGASVSPATLAKAILRNLATQLVYATTLSSPSGPGAGGGGGNGDGTNSGGGGGAGASGGNAAMIFAATVKRSASTAAGAINLNGGTGGSGFAPTAGNAGGGGGGGAGGGGFLMFGYGALTGAAPSGNWITANGGTGGTGGAKSGTGSNGSGAPGGAGGVLVTGNLSTGVLTTVVGVAGAAASGVTGGAGGACGLNL